MSETILMFDADGHVVDDVALAARVEVREVDDVGVEQRRTYLARSDADDALYDREAWDLENQDWLKRGTWDQWVEEADGYARVETLPQLLRARGVEGFAEAVQRRDVCALLQLPAWEAAPTALQDEVYAWLRGSDEPPELETKRAGQRETAARRLERWERVIEDALLATYDRMAEVVLARLRGTKARKGTRHWTPLPVETKDLDAGTIVQPGRWAQEVAEDGDRIMNRLYQDEAGVDLLDSPHVRAAVTARVRQLMSSTQARAEQVAAVILDRDASGEDLDAIVEAVKGTLDQRKIWAAQTARTEVTAAVNGASFARAVEQGVALKEWLSSRDNLVRHTHTALGGGDGQTVPLLLPFIIGGFPLMYPGDPLGPAGEVVNCRCTMLVGEEIGQLPAMGVHADDAAVDEEAFADAVDVPDFRADYVEPVVRQVAARLELEPRLVAQLIDAFAAAAGVSMLAFAEALDALRLAAMLPAEAVAHGARAADALARAGAPSATTTALTAALALYVATAEQTPPGA